MTPRQAALRAMSLTLGFDVFVAILSMVAATVLVWISADTPSALSVSSMLAATAIFTLTSMTGFVVRGVHKQVWRHMGWPDALAVLQGVALSGLLYLPLMLLMNGRLVAPWETFLVALVFWVVGLFAGRMVALGRSTNAPLQLFRPINKKRQPVLLVGDGDACVDVLRRLAVSPANTPIRILGVIEMGGEYPGRSLRGVPIMGALSELGATIDIFTERYGVTPWVAATGVARSRKNMLEILEVSSSRNAEIMALAGEESAQLMTPLNPADLLARPERVLDQAPVRSLVAGARVLVTGGGGTIGSELVRQVAKLEPASLTVFDLSEFNLYSVDMDLRNDKGEPGIIAKLGDVRDLNRLSDVMQGAQPDLVIHAAALKHVPLMEHNICEAILTNVGGAINAARAAAALGARRFVFISTDKAVDPDNVMGATKRLAELAIASIAAEAGMAAAMVRFGNVLGSSGSVVPLFESQIAKGGPVTLTDRDVTRYFMTVQEASALVLQAAALQTEDGKAELFVLDMGEPIAIQQLAESMIRLKGLVPGEDIHIVHQGLRDGEKMHEVLTYEHEEVDPTSVDGVMRVGLTNSPGRLFDKRMTALIEAAGRRDREEALRLLGLLVPEYGKRLGAKRRRHSA